MKNEEEKKPRGEKGMGGTKECEEADHTSQWGRGKQKGMGTTTFLNNVARTGGSGKKRGQRGEDRRKTEGKEMSCRTRRVGDRKGGSIETVCNTDRNKCQSLWFLGQRHCV